MGNKIFEIGKFIPERYESISGSHGSLSDVAGNGPEELLFNDLHAECAQVFVGVSKRVENFHRQPGKDHVGERLQEEDALPFYCSCEMRSDNGHVHEKSGGNYFTGFCKHETMHHSLQDKVFVSIQDADGTELLPFFQTEDLTTFEDDVQGSFANRVKLLKNGSQDFCLIFFHTNKAL